MAESNWPLPWYWDSILGFLGGGGGSQAEPPQTAVPPNPSKWGPPRNPHADMGGGIDNPQLQLKSFGQPPYNPYAQFTSVTGIPVGQEWLAAQTAPSQAPTGNTFNWPKAIGGLGSKLSSTYTPPPGSAPSALPSPPAAVKPPGGGVSPSRSTFNPQSFLSVLSAMMARGSGRGPAGPPLIPLPTNMYGFGGGFSG